MGNSLSCCIFLHEFLQNWFVWQDLPTKSSGLGVFIVGWFSYMNLRCVRVIGVLRLYIPPEWTLVICIFQDTCLLSSRIYGHKVTFNILLIFSNFSGFWYHRSLIQGLESVTYFFGGYKFLCKHCLSASHEVWYFMLYFLFRSNIS